MGLEFLGETLPIHVMMDSAAGKIMSLRRGKGKVRQLEIKQLYLQHLTNAQRVKLHKAKGEDNKSGGGTKPMTARQIEVLRLAWRLASRSDNEGRGEREGGQFGRGYDAGKVLGGGDVCNASDKYQGYQERPE